MYVWRTRRSDKHLENVLMGDQTDGFTGKRKGKGVGMLKKGVGLGLEHGDAFVLAKWCLD